ncbi:MAG TPA: PilZ domain-containing protein [Nitrospiria bacterium]|nr:PilZ domain-containing protein [Nitrospiria bacterium]
MPKKKPRLFRRLSYIARGKIKEINAQAPLEAHVINIGYGGMAFYIRGRVTGQVEITIFHEEEDGKVIPETLLGNVSWIRPMGSLNACGVEFGNLNPADHSHTMTVIEEYMK